MKFFLIYIYAIYFISNGLQTFSFRPAGHVDGWDVGLTLRCKLRVIPVHWAWFCVDLLYMEFLRCYEDVVEVFLSCC